MCTDRTLASVLTGMLLELDAAQVLLMLQSKEVLVARVTEAYAALQRHHQTQAYLAAANTLQTAVSAEACLKVDENEGVAACPKQEPPVTADVLEAFSAEERNDVSLTLTLPGNFCNASVVGGGGGGGTLQKQNAVGRVFFRVIHSTVLFS